MDELNINLTARELDSISGPGYSFALFSSLLNVNQNIHRRLVSVPTNFNVRLDPRTEYLLFTDINEIDDYDEDLVPFLFIRLDDMLYLPMLGLFKALAKSFSL